ncbi:MAG: hypothetical protein DBY24_07430, partial [Prevotellaceae bacterium]
QGTYFKISALYFKIYGLYFCPFQMGCFSNTYKGRKTGVFSFVKNALRKTENRHAAWRNALRGNEQKLRICQN